jgi:O-antigen/teichoic acid export membrane protein
MPTKDNRVSSLSWFQTLLRSTKALLRPTGQKWFLTIADQGVVGAAAFVTGIIIGRVAGKEQLGLYFLALTIIGLMRDIQYALISSPYAVISPHLQGSAHSFYTGSILLHQLALSMAGVFFLAIFGTSLSWGLGPVRFEAVVWILVPVSAMLLFRESARHICFANQQMVNALLMDSVASMVQIGGLLLLSALGILTVPRALVVMGISCSLAGLLWLRGARHDLAFSSGQVLADFRQNWSLGKWIMGCTLLQVFSYQLLLWILNISHGMAVVGLLAACYGLVALMNPFLQGTFLFLEPRTAHVFAQGGIPELRTFMGKCTLIIAMVMGLLCCVIFVFGNSMIVFFYGSQYAGHSLVLGLLAVYNLILGLDAVFYYGLRAIGRHDLNFRIDLVFLLVTIIFSLWLVKNFGLLGLALGLLTPNLVVFIIHCILFFRFSSSQVIIKK